MNIPVLDQVARCRNLLIAGMGGGFDVLCGLPIYFELRKRGQTVHLANLSNVDIAGLRSGICLTPTLVGVTDACSFDGMYFPELHLTRWFRERRNIVETVWCFHKTGAEPLLNNYRALIERLSIDGILLVDGGVDSLMRGDEVEMGTVLEDGISLSVVERLSEIPVRLMAATAFGAERDVTCSQVLENIAALAKTGGFLGSCSLVPRMEAYRSYEEAVLYVQSRPNQDPSVINSSLISAARGEFGNYHLTKKTRGSKLWVSPLMSIYWFFDVPKAARHNYMLPNLKGTVTFAEAWVTCVAAASSIPRRPGSGIPLS